MDREAIKRLLPHREPMLLVDEVTTDGDAARGRYAVTGEEWFLRGHFPEHPVVPGVVLCEIIGQTSCVLLGDKLLGKTPYFTGMDKVRFKRVAKPGDTLETTARITRSNGPFYIVEGEARIEGELCAKAELTFALMANASRP